MIAQIVVILQKYECKYDMNSFCKIMQKSNGGILIIGDEADVTDIQTELHVQRISQQMQAISPVALSDNFQELVGFRTVYCASSAISAVDVAGLFRFCQDNDVMLYFCMPGLRILQKNMRVKNVGFLSFMTPCKEPLSHWYNRAIKRLFDILVSGIVLVFILPLVLVVAGVVIKRKSTGPVLSISKVYGRRGKEFEQYFFRTDDLPAKSFLRSRSIKSLPQFINVFAGSMSIVGIREGRPDENVNLSIFRFAKPGITKCGFYENSDMWYTQNWSLCLDVIILIKTLLRRNRIE